MIDEQDAHALVREVIETLSKIGATELLQRVLHAIDEGVERTSEGGIAFRDKMTPQEQLIFTSRIIASQSESLIMVEDSKSELLNVADYRKGTSLRILWYSESPGGSEDIFDQEKTSRLYSLPGIESKTNREAVRGKIDQLMRLCDQLESGVE